VGNGSDGEADRRTAVELISRMMDGSIPYDPEGRLEAVSTGAGAKQEDKIERLKEVSLFADGARSHAAAS
jgi:hypothetical protein